MTKPKFRKSEATHAEVKDDAVIATEAVSTQDRIEAALAALLAVEATWKPTTTRDVVDAHWPTIQTLIQKRCPVEKIAVALLAAGVDVKKSTLLRLLTERRNAGRKSPKAAPTRAARPRGKTADGDASPASGDVQSKLDYFCTNDGGDAPIGDVADELQQALNVGMSDTYSHASA